MNHRPLKTIAAEIATALKREVTNVIEIGGLLAEAQEQLGARGRWLPWLRDNFPLTPRTAQNYMAASAFAREYETVSHSRLTIRGLYALVDANRDGNVQAVGAALAEAKTKSVDDDRVREIIAELQAPAGASDETEPPGEDDDDDAGEDDDDDRPFPEPPLRLTPRQAAASAIRDRWQGPARAEGQAGARISRHGHIGFRLGNNRQFLAANRDRKVAKDVIGGVRWQSGGKTGFSPLQSGARKLRIRSEGKSYNLPVSVQSGEQISTIFGARSSGARNVSGSSPGIAVARMRVRSGPGLMSMIRVLDVLTVSAA
jgi:hypothetical protein